MKKKVTIAELEHTYSDDGKKMIVIRQTLWAKLMNDPVYVFESDWDESNWKKTQGDQK